MISCLQPVCRVPSSLFPVSAVDVDSSCFLQNPPIGLCRVGKGLNLTKKPRPFNDGMRRGEGIVCSGLMLLVDPWAPNIDSQSIASQPFAFSLFPYIGFLYFITKSKSAPKLTLFGFYFLLAFVGATIPAGIYAKVHYGTSLSNVDWLHGGAESLLTLTNLFIVLGLRQALRNAGNGEKRASNDVPAIKEENNSSV